MLMYRQQLDCRDAEFLQVLDGRLAGQSRIRAAQFLRYARHPLREALDVDLVNDAAMPRGPQQLVLAPGEGGVDHDAERGKRGAITLVEGQVRGRVTELVAEQGIIPAQFAPKRLG